MIRKRFILTGLVLTLLTSGVLAQIKTDTLTAVRGSLVIRSNNKVTCNIKTYHGRMWGLSGVVLDVIDRWVVKNGYWYGGPKSPTVGVLNTNFFIVKQGGNNFLGGSATIMNEFKGCDSLRKAIEAEISEWVFRPDSFKIGKVLPRANAVLRLMPGSGDSLICSFSQEQGDPDLVRRLKAYLPPILLSSWQKFERRMSVTATLHGNSGEAWVVQVHVLSDAGLIRPVAQ